METALPNVLVTGTPCVGKTSLCRLLEDQVNAQLTGDMKYRYISLADLILQKHLYTAINSTFNVPEFDEDMVCDELEPLMQQGGVILEFHSSDFFPQRWFKYVVLLRTNNTELFDRLTARGYAERKVTENIECEIMNVTSEEVHTAYTQEQVLELQSNTVDDMESNLHRLVHLLTSS